MFVEDSSLIWTHGKGFTCMSHEDLTAVFNEIWHNINVVWNKIEEITGESLHGINMTVSPEYYIGRDGCTLTISATSGEVNRIFQAIRFYVNDELVGEFKNASRVEPFEVQISGESVIRCDATVAGVTYTDTKTISNITGMWLGAGNSYEDVMTNSHLVNISKGLTVDKNITFEDGDYLYIVLDTRLVSDFRRVDMNGVEIQLAPSVQIPGTGYTYFKSENTFQAGVYNIDINA